MPSQVADVAEQPLQFLSNQPEGSSARRWAERTGILNRLRIGDAMREAVIAGDGLRQHRSIASRAALE